MAVSFVRVYQKYDRCRVEGDYFIRAFYKEVGVYANDLDDQNVINMLTKFQQKYEELISET